MEKIKLGLFNSFGSITLWNYFIICNYIWYHQGRMNVIKMLEDDNKV